jgi:serine/threonine protein kinase
MELEQNVLRQLKQLKRLKQCINSKMSKDFRLGINEPEKSFGVLGIRELKTNGNNSTIYELKLQQNYRHLNQSFLLKMIYWNKMRTINYYVKEINYLKLISSSIHVCSFIYSEKKCGEDHKYICIIMKKMSSDLTTYIIDQTRSTGISIPELFIQLMPQFIDLFNQLRDNDTVHNDLKPDNILVDETGKLHLSDFGLTQTLNIQSKEKTRVGNIGTHAFLHPYDFKHSIYGGGTDMYMLGMSILYTITNKYIDQKKYNTIYTNRFNHLYKDTIKYLYNNHNILFQCLELLLDIVFDPLSGNISNSCSKDMHHHYNTNQRILDIMSKQTI